MAGLDFTTNQGSTECLDNTYLANHCTCNFAGAIFPALSYLCSELSEFSHAGLLLFSFGVCSGV